MFKNYKKLYLKEQEQMEYLRQYYRDRNEEHYKIIDNLRDVIKIYEQDYKKMKRLSNFGLWCGIGSLVFVTLCTNSAVPCLWCGIGSLVFVTLCTNSAVPCLWCGIGSLVFVTVSVILKAVL